MAQEFPHGPTTIWTDGSAATKFRHFMTGPMATSKMKSVRANYRICCVTHQTGLLHQVYYEVSDDGINWTQSGSWVLGSSTEDGDGDFNTGTFADISSNIWTYRYVRFGIECYNYETASTAKEFATALLRMEFRAT